MSRAERADWIARRFASLSLSVLLSVVWLALLAVTSSRFAIAGIERAT